MQYLELVLKAEALYKTVLKTQVNAEYGLHQIQDAIQFYMKNQTAGKITLKPSLTPAGSKPVEGVKIDSLVV